MAGNKTIATKTSVLDFINSVEQEEKKQDALFLLDLMKKVTGEEAIMWGTSLIGFGNYHYRYESGREGDFFIVGFSPRKTAMTLYIMPGFKRYADLLAKLGKYKTGKSCLYIKRLSEVDLSILEELIKDSVDYMNKKYNSA